MGVQPAGVSPLCSCAQTGVTDLDLLDDMIASGVDQWEASIRLWGRGRAAHHWHGSARGEATKKGADSEEPAPMDMD